MTYSQEWHKAREDLARDGLAITFDPAPLADLIQQRAGQLGMPVEDLCRRLLGVNSLPRLRSQRWVREDTVDRVTCALGMHPANLYPEWTQMAEGAV